MSPAAHWPCPRRKREDKHKQRMWEALPCLRTSRRPAGNPEGGRAGWTAGSSLEILLLRLRELERASVQAPCCLSPPQ